MPLISTPFPVAEPDSVVDYTVDFGHETKVAADLDSAVWTMAVRSTTPGYAADLTPADRLSGAATVAGKVTTQRLQNLQAGNDYLVSVQGTFTDGQVLTVWGVLRCQAIGALAIKGQNQQVGFDYIKWLEIFPELSYVSEINAMGFFAEAEGLHANDGTGPVAGDDVQQLYLLNLLTAHLAARYAQGSALASSLMTGPIVSASEGSVSVSSQALVAPGTQAWYLTTKYGSDYWFATAPYRTMHYRVAAPRVFDPFWARLRGSTYY